MSETIRVDVLDKKYTVVLKDGHLCALRHGIPWRNCVGDGLILALMLEVHELREKVNTLEILEKDPCKIP